MNALMQFGGGGEIIEEISSMRNHFNNLKLTCLHHLVL